MKPRNINNSLPLQPLVPDQENKNKKNEEKSVNPVKITMGSGLNYIEQESLGGKYLTHDLSIKIADISEEIIQQAILSAMSIYKFSITDDEINSFKETLVLSSIDSLSKLVLNNPLSVLFTSTVRRNNNRAKMNVEFDSWICTRCC